MWTILRKELRTYFGTPIAYLVASAFVVICALFLWFFDNDFNVFNLGNANLNTFFFIVPWALMFLVPALTMKQFSEEEQSGTLSWLFTQPIALKNIVLGKYFSILILLILMILPTIFFIYTVNYFSLDGKIDLGSILCGYLGIFLLGSFFAAIGIFVSTLTQSQVLAYVVSVFVCFLLYFGFDGLASYNLLGSLDFYVQQIGSKFHYDSFVKGIIDTRDLLYFLCLIVFALLLSNYNINQKIQ